MATLTSALSSTIAVIGDFLQVGQGDILLDILDQDQAIAFAIFGDIGHPCVDRVLWQLEIAAACL